MPFRWDPLAQRYRRANGQFVPITEVRRALDAALKSAATRAQGLTEQLRAGTLTLEEWRTAMRTLIKSTHLYSAAAAAGGWHNLSQSDYGRVGAMVRQEYGFLELRSRAIATGVTPLDGRLRGYAAQYAQAGRTTFYQAMRASHAANGFLFEANILHPAEHCGQCLSESARGRVPIGTLSAIGTRTCRRNDRCSMDFFKTRGGRT